MLDSAVLYSPQSGPLEAALRKLQKISEIYEVWNKTGRNPNTLISEIGEVLGVNPGRTQD